VVGKLEADVIWGGLLAALALFVIWPTSPRYVSGSILRSSLVYGLPLVPHRLAAQVGGMLSRLLLNGMVGVAAVGVYSMGFRLATAANVVGTALNLAFAPLFILALKEAEASEPEKANEIRAGLAKSSLVSIVLVSCTALAISAWGREIIAIIATPAFEESWKVLALINASSVAYAFYLPFSQSVLQSHEGTRVLPAATAASAATSVLVSLALVPSLGIVGAAVASLAGNVVLALMGFWMGQHRVRLPLQRDRWLTVLGTSLVALAAFNGTDALPVAWWIRFGTKTAILGVAVGILLAAAGGLSVVRQVLRRKARDGQRAPVDPTA
jgi:O-antigen/teichoic acid export membrane protein